MTQDEANSLLAKYKAIDEILERGIVAAEAGDVRRAVQSGWHALQDLKKLDAERVMVNGF